MLNINEGNYILSKIERFIKHVILDQRIITPGMRLWPWYKVLAADYS
ncbi:hypothetical protein DCCM_3428 [Desulfocucumis palustris]|uniref:Uncharacterized protein n=1 Tax=Desulfocucumis palustris TaxID=1898651 RepID=A0A2L2XJ87_9FIRM|nr:hypothetical protein DCCM_3428 [Desulfocucumis palustris]